MFGIIPRTLRAICSRLSNYDAMSLQQGIKLKEDAEGYDLEPSDALGTAKAKAKAKAKDKDKDKDKQE